MSEPWRDRIEPGPDLFAAVGRNLALFVLPILVLAGAGVGYGLLRTAQYKAEARVTIGQLSLTTQGIPGFLTAASNLAAAYARAITAEPVAAGAGRAAGVSTETAAEALSASSIPNTPLFRIEAEHADRDVAIKLANGASDAIIEHILSLNRRDDTRNTLLTKYKSASRTVARLRAEFDAAKDGEEAVEILGDYRTSRLRMRTLANLYAASAAGDVAQNLLQVIAPAADANSDRASTAELWGLIGALVGVLLGLALAAGRESKRRAAAVE